MKNVWLAPALLVLAAGVAATQPAENYPTPRTRGAAPAETATPKMDHGAAQKQTGKEPQGAVTRDSKDTMEAKQHGLSDHDRKFLNYLANLNRAEIEVGRYAAQKAQSPEVKAFARLMVSDHSAVGKQLVGLETAKTSHAHARRGHVHARWRHAHARKHFHAAAHAQTPKFSKEAEEMMASFKDKSGADFDRAFMAEQVEYHTQPGAKFDKEIKDTDSEKLRNFAKATEEAFKGHLEMAKAINDTRYGGKP